MDRRVGLCTPAGEGTDLERLIRNHQGAERPLRKGAARGVRGSGPRAAVGLPSLAVLLRCGLGPNNSEDGVIRECVADS